jgi:hypothetical protein
MFYNLAPDPYFKKNIYHQIYYSMSVKGAGNKSVAGDDNKSISSDRVNLIDLDYYSISEHITEKDLFTRIWNFSQGYLESATLSILNSRIHNSIHCFDPNYPFRHLY